MEAIKDIAEAHNIFVIEDCGCAQSIGCTITEGEFGGKSTGNLGRHRPVVFPFFPSKKGRRIRRRWSHHNKQPIRS